MPHEPTPPAPPRLDDRDVMDSDGERRAKAADGRGFAVEPPLPTNDEEPEVGLSQKGVGEDAVVRRETEI